MKKLTDILFSMVTSVILLLIFGVAIGYATFAENSSGTPYAHEFVYNAKWFELLLFRSNCESDRQCDAFQNDE